MEKLSIIALKIWTKFSKDGKRMTWNLIGKMPLYGPRRHCFGHLVSERGIEVDKEKIEVREQLPPPVNVKGIRSFLGHAGFYRRFIKDFSQITRPLTAILAKDVPFEFTDECLRAFETIKKALISAPIIQPLDWSIPFEIIVDGP